MTAEALLPWITGPVAGLIISLVVIRFLYRDLKEERQICKEAQARADAAEEKVVEILKADIIDRKERDKTIELLTKAAANSRGNGNG
jgi:hypothetical protein